MNSLFLFSESIAKASSWVIWKNDIYKKGFFWHAGMVCNECWEWWRFDLVKQTNADCQLVELDRYWRMLACNKSSVRLVYKYNGAKQCKGAVIHSLVHSHQSLIDLLRTMYSLHSRAALGSIVYLLACAALTPSFACSFTRSQDSGICPTFEPRWRKTKQKPK